MAGLDDWVGAAEADKVWIEKNGKSENDPAKWDVDLNNYLPNLVARPRDYFVVARYKTTGREAGRPGEGKEIVKMVLGKEWQRELANWLSELEFVEAGDKLESLDLTARPFETVQWKADGKVTIESTNTKDYFISTIVLRNKADPNLVVSGRWGWPRS